MFNGTRDSLLSLHPDAREVLISEAMLNLQHHTLCLRLLKGQLDNPKESLHLKFALDIANTIGKSSVTVQHLLAESRMAYTLGTADVASIKAFLAKMVEALEEAISMGKRHLQHDLLASE